MYQDTDRLPQDLCTQMVLQKSSDSGDAKSKKLLELEKENRQLKKQLEDARMLQTITDSGDAKSKKLFELEKENRQLKKQLEDARMLQSMTDANHEQQVKINQDQDKKLQHLCHENKKLQDKIEWLMQQLKSFWSCSDEPSGECARSECDETHKVTEEQTDPFHRLTYPVDLTSSGQPLDQDSYDFCNDHWCTMNEEERNDSFYYQRQPIPQKSEVHERNSIEEKSALRGGDEAKDDSQEPVP